MQQTQNQGQADQGNYMPPQVVILQMLQGLWVARAVQVAASLGLADALREGPKGVEELAQVTKTHAPSLYRLLRSLACLGIFAESSEHVFANTDLSEVLRSDRPNSLYDVAKMFGAEWQWKALGELEYSVRTGKAAVDHIYGMSIWEYLDQHPEEDESFHRALTLLSQQYDVPVLQAYDFSSFSSIVDVGGGQGHFLQNVLSHSPKTRGMLFDRPSAIEGANALIGQNLQVRDRVRLVGGDFFTEVPQGGDAYILKSVIHDWGDEESIKILRNCRRAMKPSSKLLVVEAVIRPGGAETVPTKFTDLLMLVNDYGRERTSEEFASLYEAAGFKLTRIVPAGFIHSIIEGVPV